MSEEKRYSGEDVQRMFLEFRGLDPDIDQPCKGCDGAGTKAYGSTATWHGGAGGQAITTDVCDRCWGSGNANRPWPSWRERKS